MASTSKERVAVPPKSDSQQPVDVLRAALRPALGRYLLASTRRPRSRAFSFSGLATKSSKTAPCSSFDQVAVTGLIPEVPTRDLCVDLRLSHFRTPVPVDRQQELAEGPILAVVCARGDPPTLSGHGAHRVRRVARSTSLERFSSRHYRRAHRIQPGARGSAPRVELKRC